MVWRSTWEILQAGRIFASRPNARSYYETYPWRESGQSNFDFLRGIVEDSDSDDDRMRAWEAMIQTRQPQVIEFAIEQAEPVRPPDHSLPLEEWLRAYLHLVGFDYQDGSLIRTCRDALENCYLDNGFRIRWGNCIGTLIGERGGYGRNLLPFRCFQNVVVSWPLIHDEYRTLRFSG